MAFVDGTRTHRSRGGSGEDGPLGRENEAPKSQREKPERMQLQNFQIGS